MVLVAATDKAVTPKDTVLSYRKFPWIFIQNNGYNFTVLYDDRAKIDYNVAGIPTVFIVDGDGIIRYKHVGYRPENEEIWRAQIENIQSRLSEWHKISVIYRCIHNKLQNWRFFRIVYFR